MMNSPEESKLGIIIDSFFGLASHNEKVFEIAGYGYSPYDYVMEQLGIYDVYLCGGAITSIFSGAKVHDLDLYLSDITDLPELIALLVQFNFEQVFRSKNAITFKRKSGKSNKVWVIQVVTTFSGKPETIFESFDFTICTGAYSFSEAKFILGPRFLQDIAKRRLVYQGRSEYPICAMYRTKKFQQRGYFCPGSTIMHIALSIVRLNIQTYGDLKRQLMGIDTMYLQDLLSKEKYKDEIPVDYAEFLVDAFSSDSGFALEDTYEEAYND